MNPRPDRPRAAPLLLALSLFWVAACGGGSGGGGKDGSSQSLLPEQDAPGLNITILELDGASGFDDMFETGDKLSITFTLAKEDGTPCALEDLDSLRALVSGPTFNYQRVIAETTAPLNTSVDNGDGTYTFTFAERIPDVYLPPLNDSPAYDEDDGELGGQPLLGGTYTVGLYGYYEYVVLGPVGLPESFRDIGDATLDFRLGNTPDITPRAVVGLDNCNNCHARLEAHGGFRRNLTICLMCHTAGAEDNNEDGETPGVSVDFRIMIHKIHSARNLPSVLGMTTNPDGTRDYGAEPVPYELAGFGGKITDYSEVGFPVWPSLTEPMPKDQGYSSLTPDEQAQEDAQRLGPVSCDSCHGDPDGPGPELPPANGDQAYLVLTRRVCGSCHDDIVWEYPYEANGQVMPPLFADGSCIECHQEQGDPLAVRDGHLHPLVDPAFNPGLHFNLMDVAEGGDDDGDGAVDPGEKLTVTFTITDDQGLAVDPSEVSSLSVAVSGPTTNLNLLLNQSFPLGRLGGPQPYTVEVPQTRLLEFVGRSTAGVGDVFFTSGSPHYDSSGAPTVVEVVSDAGPGAGMSALSTPGPAFQNFVDVDVATGFDRNDVIVVDEGLAGSEEYLRIQYVDGNRLWFSSPATSGYPFGLRFDHAPGAPVREVALTPLTAGVDYDLDEAAGSVTETAEIGNGTAVLVSYTTDFVMPAAYPGPLNDSPDVDETSGKWAAKSLVSGTYLLALWGARPVDVVAYGEANAYRGASMDEAFPFVVGEPAPIEPWDLIDGPETCYGCHGQLIFHGGGRGGFDTCLVCHGSAGSEDRPQYVAADAPATTGVGTDFRQMLHKIHMGAELANASTYTVVGFGTGYPENFSEHTYGTVHYPAMPSGTKDCISCHGEDNQAWKQPEDRNHPTEQGAPVLAWTQVCGSCHDSDAASAHAAANTSAAGVEACEVCHGPTATFRVELEHKIR